MKLRIQLTRIVSLKYVLWVRHKNRQIINRTSDEKVIKKRRFKIKGENERNKEENGNDKDDESRKGRKYACVY